MKLKYKFSRNEIVKLHQSNLLNDDNLIDVLLSQIECLPKEDDYMTYEEHRNSVITTVKRIVLAVNKHLQDWNEEYHPFFEYDENENLVFYPKEPNKDPTK